MLEKSSTCRFADLEDLGKTLRPAIVGVGDACPDGALGVEGAQEGKALPVTIVLAKLCQIVVIVLVHCQHIIKARKVASYELAGDAGALHHIAEAGVGVLRGATADDAAAGLRLPIPWARCSWAAATTARPFRSMSCMMKVIMTVSAGSGVAAAQVFEK